MELTIPLLHDMDGPSSAEDFLTIESMNQSRGGCGKKSERKSGLLVLTSIEARAEVRTAFQQVSRTF
jgi:hypothetical protein